MQIPIFPLPIFILPEGKSRLRIFEPRYLKMVKIALKENGFAILLTSNDHTNNHIASWVDITDFDEDDDGILLIDVKCKNLVSVTNSFIDNTNLMWAKIETINHWPEHQHNDATLAYSKILKSFYQQSDGASSLYSGDYVEQANWVVARWLEILPIDNKYKESFMLASSFNDALLLLGEILPTKNVNISDLN